MPDAERPARLSGTPVHSAMIECPNCGVETEHRILRIDPRHADRPGAGLRGIARCRVCRLTHPFQSTPKAQVRVEAVISEGRVSHTEGRSLPEGVRIEVGSMLPGSEGPELRVLRIDRNDGTRV
ncbi:MAG TPA: HVO_0476 family zinc finger protein, partial [Thermoplasmata archaeon]|nr:HVO_0476 family zinc finger protein [Thermoplasmata archaeon]